MSTRRQRTGRIHILSGETEPISFTVRDKEGVAVSLTGATVLMTAVALETWETDYANRADVTVDDGDIEFTATLVADADQVTNKGVMAWTPTVVQTERSGEYAVEFKITDTAGSIQKYPRDKELLVLEIGTSLLV